MSKIQQQKIFVDIKPIQRVRLTKISDDVFKGFHPNNIHEGFVVEGILMRGPVVGNNCWVEQFATSVVTEIIDENRFKTRNSTYKIEYLEY